MALHCPLSYYLGAEVMGRERTNLECTEDPPAKQNLKLARNP
jgi:hypothetical protein